MNNSVYVVLGSLWVACAIALLYTYKDYKYYVETITLILSISSAIITIWQALFRK